MIYPNFICFIFSFLRKFYYIFNVLWLCEVRNSNCLIINYLNVLHKYKITIVLAFSPHLAKPLLAVRCFSAVYFSNLVFFRMFGKNIFIMKYTYKKEDFTKETVDTLISEVNTFYKDTFTKLQETVINSNYLNLTNTSEEFEDILSDYTGQIFEVIFYYSDFKNLTSNDVKDRIHKFRENQIDKMKLFKEKSFDCLLDHFESNFETF